MRILIVYGTGEGQTRKIAETLGGQIRRADHHVEVHRGDQLPEGLSPAACDGVLVGASLHAGHHQAYIRRFIRRHRPELRAVPSAFFSVSGSAASPDPAAQAQIRELVEVFLAEEGWQPDRWATFAGAIPYTRYGRLKRWVMRRIIARAGGPTDTSRDWELTDWEEVERFGAGFLELVEGKVPKGRRHVGQELLS
ncbi:hypothetical protein AN478_13015 [Thiohalorhabdus denitrificans]|uniref:Menaquinone-dependent protoporphyrinogen oxidase n=1 Tax=Thiohalorhabdus denitrificans TaxID=381306 RepID=A0A0P9GGN9_9GAMM|nr:flavodoxin domain-containing protein [Thiohalorhabdus denitrificans]KPV39190.1 hypothetical protein AN478_13015 [Thiohalorhabdus denitrificans]SCX75529.1 menaquinone-dependent protoporphyrinogen oxidase [Thiohalorhabdus denitrificans]